MAHWAPLDAGLRYAQALEVLGNPHQQTHNNALMVHEGGSGAMSGCWCLINSIDPDRIPIWESAIVRPPSPRTLYYAYLYTPCVSRRSNFQFKRERERRKDTRAKLHARRAEHAGGFYASRAGVKFTPSGIIIIYILSPWNIKKVCMYIQQRDKLPIIPPPFTRSVSRKTTTVACSFCAPFLRSVSNGGSLRPRAARLSGSS